MSGSMAVVVLTPNGRRQTVKVTPNTTILQVLEEVCKKQGFLPEEYDIKHHNHVLDSTSLIRFSGLPNNALLEMAKTRKTREESDVLLLLQLESGERLTGTFTPADTLWDVVKKLCPQEADPDSNPVVVFTQREIYGVDSLMETTLRSLGLLGGRALLRLLHRTVEELHHQANISGPLPKHTAVEEASHKETKSICGTPTESHESHVFSVTDKISHESAPGNRTEEPESREMTPVTEHNSNSVESMDVENSDTSLSSVASALPERTTEHIPDGPIRLLGERNAIVFSPSMAQAVSYEDLPDDFFDHTVEDVRSLYRDLRRQRAELEDNPFTTKAMRDLNEAKRILNHLHQYRRVVLRIQFPDQIVLQGTFTPLETISTVAEFVRGYLEEPSMPFHLYTTPPKTVLPPQARLVDVNCVPCALIHFGCEKPRYTYLRKDLLLQFTSPTAAAIAASQSR
ncbi:tether containing UBX domain for GLUT4 isoform X3 [Anabrus simplex]